MSNMSYCRFENTASDLADCRDHFLDTIQDHREDAARTKLLRLAFEIVALYIEQIGCDEITDLDGLDRIEREIPRSLNAIADDEVSADH